MKRQLSRSVFIALCLVVLFTLSADAGSDIVNIDRGKSYSAHDLYQQALSLQERYPDIIRVEVLGTSTDNRPVYAVIMTAGVDQVESLDELYVERMHFLVEAGNHSREDVNPVIAMKMIEDYAKDYRNENTIPAFNMQEILNRSVLHFIPLANPDGFDLVRQGASAAQTDRAKNALTAMRDKNYPNFKASMTGVDHNRNYISEFFNTKTNQWESFWMVEKPQFYSGVPSGEFYAGTHPGSEPEVTLVMDYIRSYDFRNVLSYHSRGKIIYWDKFRFSHTDFNQRSLDLARRISGASGYALIPARTSMGTGSGFLSDFVASETNKPVMTVETLPAGVRMPAAQSLYREAYRETWLLPLHAEAEGHAKGYFRYRLYVEGKYVRDFTDLTYAQAHAMRRGGAVKEGVGTPIRSIDNLITRKEFLERLLERHVEFVTSAQKDEVTLINGVFTINEDARIAEDGRERVLSGAREAFVDYNTMFAGFARQAGIVSYPQNGRFRPNDFITPAEASVILYNTHERFGERREHQLPVEVTDLNLPQWAVKFAQYAVQEGLIPRSAFHSPYLGVEDVEWLFSVEIEAIIENMTEKSEINTDVYDSSPKDQPLTKDVFLED